MEFSHPIRRRYMGKFLNRSANDWSNLKMRERFERLPPSDGKTHRHRMSSQSTRDLRAAEPPVTDLLEQARLGGSRPLGDLLQLYRNYLTVLATTQLDRRLRRRMSPSDLVQEAMLAAHRDFQSFRGVSEPELLCWLRQILINCLRDAIDTHLNAQKRDLRREVSIEQVNQSLDHSTMNLANLLADAGP